MKTQKARGIIYGLREFFTGSYARETLLSEPNHHLIEKAEDIENPYLNLPAFARPCPKTPKHGFIDSRRIETREELIKLWKKVKQQDPDGEIILGEDFEEVDFNSIYVSSGQLSIGKGNDGATGGKNSINFPVAPFAFSKTFHKKIGVNGNDAIYIEAIKAMPQYDCESSWFLTQMRGGPQIKGTAVDYVPVATKVKKVIVPSNNLVEWEKTCKKMESGTVVYGNGYTLASHAGVHCIINKIPFITSEKPKVGATLKPVAGEEVKLSTNLFRKGVNIGSKMMKDMEPKKAFYFSVSVLHNWAYLKNSEHASYLLGAASIIYAQLCSAMIFGEQRHCRVCQNKYDYCRDEVYSNTFSNAGKSISKISKAIKCYHLHDWTEGYGGLPWAICSWHTYVLWKAITKVYNSQRKYLKDDEVAKVIGSINNTTNLAHNNGWWFNKFMEKADMDFLAEETGIATLGISDIYFDIYNKVNSTKSVSQRIKCVENVKEPFSKDKNGKGVWCVGNFPKKYDRWEKDEMEIKVFKEEGAKEKYKSIKFNKDEYKKMLNKAKTKGMTSIKTINLPFIKDKVILPDGRKVAI